MIGTYWRYAIRRTIQALLVFGFLVFVFSAIVNVKMEVVDRADVVLQTMQSAALIRNQTPGGMTDEEYKALYDATLERNLTASGLNGPLLVRIYHRAVDVLTLNLGEGMTTIQGLSNQKSHKVVDVILETVPPTAMLFGGAFIAQVIVALFLGLRNARRPGSFGDRATAVIGLAGLSVPSMVAAMFALAIFVFAVRIFPSDPWVYRYPQAWSEVGPWVWEFVSHYTLPFLTLVAIGFGGWAFAFRNILIGTLQEDFVSAARARGLPERRILFGHVARASAPPLVTAVAYGFVGTLWGSFLVEPIFQWPGIGYLYLYAIRHSGLTHLFLGISVLISAFYLAATLILDLIYGLLDPRIKVGASALGGR
jgi:peptide/nickel transport system permease protein